MSKGAVELGEFECRQGGHKVRELALEHQCKKIAADGGSPWQSTLRNPLARSVDLTAPHERACSVMSTRAWRARRLRCLRNTAPSLAAVSRRRWVSAYWRKAVRTSAARLRRRDDVSVSSSKSFEVASSMAILFMRRIISADLGHAQGCALSREGASDGWIVTEKKT